MQHKILGGKCVKCRFGAGFIAHNGWDTCSGRRNTPPHQVAPPPKSSPVHHKLTPEQQEKFDNAIRIGEILASTVNTIHSPPIRINPRTCKEAIGYYAMLGAKKPILQRGEQFVRNCILYDENTFAACAQRTLIFHNDIVNRFVCWTGGGKALGATSMNSMKFFTEGFEFMIASLFIDSAVFEKLESYLEAQ